MAFQWLKLRIGEEQDRRSREARIQERLPLALEQVRRSLAVCIGEYAAAFGPESAEMHGDDAAIRIMVREKQDEGWQPSGSVTILIDAAIPGLQVDRGGDRLVIEIGLLPDGTLFFRDRAADQYVSEEELTRRILDRAFFPRLAE